MKTDDEKKENRVKDFLSEGANLNTALLTIVMLLSCWTLNRVSVLSETMAAASVTAADQKTEILDLKLRMLAVEAKVQANSLDIVRLQKDTVTTTTTTR